MHASLVWLIAGAALQAVLAQRMTEQDIVHKLEAVIRQQQELLESQQRILTQLDAGVVPAAEVASSQPQIIAAQPMKSWHSEPEAIPIDSRFRKGGPERLYYLRNFMNTTEVNTLLAGKAWCCEPARLHLTAASPCAAASPRFERSSTYGGDDAENTAGELVRTSSTAYVGADIAREVVETVTSRMHHAARVPTMYGEELQVTRYDEGQLYQFHWDSQ